MSKRNTSLRSLPAVEALLSHEVMRPALREVPRALVVEAVRAELADERERLKASRSKPATADALAVRAAARAAALARPALCRVLNATGVVLHTNLGRAPLAAAARKAVAEVAAGYSSLEYDLDLGRRGQRGLGVERWLERLTGAEAAFAVNNGAAAVLLVLSALASGRKVAVSRGELVEIGGSFRIPEILEKSGAELVEVGTTNRTHLRDYQKALAKHKDLGAVLRVHRSNFEIEGFTTRPSIEELAAVTRKARVPLIEDLGSGALCELSLLGLEPEPTVAQSLARGCDIVTFSGDKLLGAMQAGLVLGRKRLVERVRRDPLARALRLDKLSLAALEATLPAYLDPELATQEVPVLAMLAASEDDLEARAGRLAKRIESLAPALRASAVRSTGEVGGGSLPRQKLPSWAVALDWPGHGAAELDAAARASNPPLIAFIRSGRLRLDVRTLSEAEAEEAAQVLAAMTLGG